MVKKKRRIGRYVAIVGGIAVAALLIKACAFPHRAPPRLLTAAATIGDIDQTVLASGTLHPLKLVDVGAQVSGQVKSLKVSLGDQVVKGQVIATIDPAPQRNALLTAQATLEQQKAQRLAQEAMVEQDKLVLQRQAITLAGQASSQQDYETADANLKSAKANLAATEAQIRQASVSVDTARINLGYTQIMAPIDGVVIATPTKEGQTVNAVQSAPTIVELANVATMTVKAQISEADVIKVRPGQTVYFTILGDPDRRYYARLRAIEPAPDSVTSSTSSTASSASSSSSTSSAVYFNGLFDVPNPSGVLRDQMTAQVYVVLASVKHVLSIPSAALSPAGAPGRYTVRVLTDPRRPPEVRTVLVGVNNNVSAQVLSGLKAGDKVVVGEGPAKPAPAQVRLGPPGGPGRGGPPGLPG
jgi:membrane fusion protein, macrolide-specific efflux system